MGAIDEDNFVSALDYRNNRVSAVGLRLTGPGLARQKSGHAPFQHKLPQTH